MITRERLTGRRQKYLISVINHVIHAMNVLDNRTVHYERSYEWTRFTKPRRKRTSEEEERYLNAIFFLIIALLTRGVN